MSDQFSDRQWFAVLSKPGQQRRAADQLERQGYRVFLPMALTERRNGNHGVEVVRRPLFDRYVFVGVDYDQPFSPLWSTVGVQCVVCGHGRLPIQVPLFALRRVATWLAKNGDIVDLRSARPEVAGMAWESGQELEVIDGPFRNLTATLLDWADKRREMARVLVDIFGRPTPIEAPVSVLRPRAAGCRAA